MREQTIWLPVDITAIGLEWAEMKSAEISRAAFLFGDSLPAIRKSARRPSASAQAEPTAQIPVKPRYIFHTAFCCSTLLARALDREGASLAVKEPDILMKLANLERNQPGIAARLVPTIETGLFQHPGFDERIVVKPTNAANRIIPHLMQNTAARAIIIHSDLESFLLSIARKGEEGRIFVRRLYNIFLADTPFAQSLNARDVFTFSDLQIAAFVWAMQCAQIEAAVSLAPDRYRLLHCDLFLADPEPVLGRADAFLGLGMSEKDISAQAQSDLFARNSKFQDQAYDAGLRDHEKDEAKAQFADSIAFAMDWAGKLPLPKMFTGKHL